MERKTFSSGDKFINEKDQIDYLPKVPIKLKESPYITQDPKKIRKKYSDFSVKTQESDINLFSKFSKPESTFSIQPFSEERKEVRLPVLNKKEKKKNIMSSAGNYRSPRLSPSMTKTDFEDIQKEEQFEAVPSDPAAEVFKSPLRGSSASRNFRSRKSKIRSKKYSKKQRDDNLDTLLMYRNNSDFEFLMNEYIRRQGLEENTKIFILTGQHDFIRRALKRRGWTENKNSSSTAYHLKWCYNDSDYDYKVLKPEQFYNHFQNNRELTTKSGLLKNLRNVTDFKVNVDTFFPRCYDLGDGVQVKELIKDFYQTAVFNVIKKAILGFDIENSLLSNCLEYAKQLLNDFQSKGEKVKKRFELKTEDFKKCSDLKFEVKSTKSNLELLETGKFLIKEISKYLPQILMEGCENVWIIKPGQNARGSGVRCVRDLEEILDSGCKMQSRVVQKYSESPLLVPLPQGLCKFDLRIWVLVTSVDPAEIFMYNSCYCRLCQEPYNLSSLDPFRHLANYSIQKSVAKSQSSTIWTLSQLLGFLKTLNKSWLEILPKIHNIIIQTLLPVCEIMEPRPGCFELYGFDILIDSYFEPWLLEVNLSPACSERTEWITETLDCMGEGLLKIVLDGGTQGPLYNQSMGLQRELKGDTQEWVMLFKGVKNEDVGNLNVNLEIIGEKFNLKREKMMEKRFLMNKAAFFIQFQLKKYMEKVRAEKKRLNHCVLNLQKIIRRKLAWGKARQRAELLACIKIQSFFRMHLAKKTRKGLEFWKNMRFIQKILLSFVQRRHFCALKVEKSCIDIQKVFRKMLAIHIVKEKKFYLKAVIFIQRFWKTFYLKKLRNTKNLQSVLRGFIDRVDTKKRISFKKAIICIQTGYRKFLSHQQVSGLKRKTAEKIIAKYEKFRIFVKSLSLMRYGHAATVIQKYWRRHHSKKIFLSKKLQKKLFIDKIFFIQKILKGFKSRKKFLKTLQTISALKIQKKFRGFRCRKYFEVLKKVYKSAVMIQKHFRRFQVRKRYLLMRRIYREEHVKRKNFITKKKDLESRAMKATERLFKGRAMPEVPNPAAGRAERLLFDREDKIDRIRTIYNQFDETLLINSKYERSSLIKSIIEDIKPKRDKSKSKKCKKKPLMTGKSQGKNM
jgi:tubulin monoglycylase TTLL3/8